MKNFDPSHQHHLQMEISPERKMWYQFGCRNCRGRLIISAKDTRGKTIEALYEGVLETVNAPA